MPILRDNTLEVQSRSPEQTLRLGQRLGELLTRGDVICLEGSLGAGKTTFSRGIGQGWGSSSRLTSPTYTLINMHHRQKDEQILYHVDAYRLETPASLTTVDFDDVFDGNGPVIIEWPHRLKRILPQDYLWIRIDHDDVEPTRRLLTLSSQGDRHRTLLDAFRQSVYGV